MEKGEECDCGGEEACRQQCCDPKTCKLAPGAECATGGCCDLNTCKVNMVVSVTWIQLMGRATMCRATTGICDLAEYCNGETADCPADFFVQDGHVCPGRENVGVAGDGASFVIQEFCYQGACGSRPDQCEFIWGPTGKEAIPECYAQNMQGIVQGNCGYDASTAAYSRCQDK